jgi:hypothetical protein
MERRSTVKSLCGIAACGLILTASKPGPPGARTVQAQSGPTASTTTASDQVDLALTVYSNDLALVRDVRDIRLSPAQTELKFVDIAATVNPATVHLRSLTEPSRLAVLEQNYQYDLLEPEKLLRKYLDRDVTLVRTRQENGSTRTEEVTARLLALNNGPVWRIGNEIVTGLTADHIRFPELPDNMYAHPTLVWSLANTGAARHRVEASYLAASMGWAADYVLAIGRDERTSDLNGWVTLTNGSGTTFRNAKLQLVAGEINRVAVDQAARALEVTAARPAAPPAFAEEAFSEYHLYSLERRTSIQNNETKQITLLTGSAIPIAKAFVVEGRAFYYRNAQQPGTPLRDDVRVYYRLRNARQSNLGMPMPAGIVRVYQTDSAGNLQFAGEDRIGHTPADESITLHIGNAFDVVCDRQQSDYQKLGSSTAEMAFTVTLRNHKSVPIDVEVNEPIGGTWQMVQASHEWTKPDAWSARFTVPVAANGTATLAYRVRTRW